MITRRLFDFMPARFAARSNTIGSEHRVAAALIPSHGQSSRGGAEASSRRCYRCLIVGDSSTGKSSLLHRYMRDTFTEQGIANTIGFDYVTKDVNGDSRICFFDFGGQDRFRRLQTSMASTADVIVIVFALDDARTFDDVVKWHTRMMSARTANTAVPPIVLVGTKADLCWRREEQQQQTCTEEAAFAVRNDHSSVSRSDIDDLVESVHLAAYVETSAKTGDGVQACFDTILQMCK